MENRRVRVKGWVNNIRSLGKIVFIEMLDNNSIETYTLVIKKSENESLWKNARKIKIGSAIIAEGVIPREIFSKKGAELHVQSLKVLAEPEEPLPIDTTGKTPFHLDTGINFRYLAVRIPEQRAIFRIRSVVLRRARSFLEKMGLIEVNTPKLVAAGAEGGATLFRVDYFGENAYLSQSPQLYKQMLMAGFTGVYEITPYFRAEKFSTIRHLNESWGIDVEIGFINNMEDILNLLENLVTYIVEGVVEEAEKELRTIGAELSPPKTPFPRLDYREVVKILREHGVEIEEGDDLDTESERVLGKIMGEKGYDAYFIVNYPWEIKPFYIMREGNGSRSFDLDYRGLELSSGGQREHRYAELRKNIVEKGLNPEDFTFYLNAFKYGMPPHGGFGLGVERLIMQILGLENIREAILFPRDRFRLVP